MNLKWSFIINANYPYLNGLLHYLDSEDVLIYEEGEEGIDLTQYFTSVHFNHLTDPTEIYVKAYQLSSFINAIDFLIQENKDNHNEIRLDRLIDIEKRINIHYDKNVSVNKIDIDFSINQPIEARNTHIIAQIILVAKSEEFVQNILFIIAQGMDFQRMYQALDEIKHFLKSKGTNLENLGFPRKGKVNDFTHTANNYQTLGLKARHGTTSQQPPANVMSIREAQKLLTDIVKKIFIDFYGIELPVIEDMKFDVSDLFDI